MNKGLFFSICFLLAACGAGSDSGSNSPAATDSTVPPGDTPLFAALQFDDAYRSQVSAMEIATDGHWCYLLRQAEQEDGALASFDWDLSWKQTLRCQQGDSVQFEYQPEAGTSILDITFSPLSDLFVLEAVKETPRNGIRISAFSFRISQYSLHGELLRQRQLKQVVSKKDLAWYEQQGDQIVHSTTKNMVRDGVPLVPENSFAQLEWGAGHLYLLAHALGITLYQFDHNLDVHWSRQIMPSYSWLWQFGTANRRSHFTAHDDGRLAVAFSLTDDDVDIYNTHFNHPIADLSPGYDTGVTLLQSDGSVIRSFLATIPDLSEYSQGVFWQHDQLTLVGTTLANKKNTGTGKQDRDAFFANFDEYGTLLDSQILHWNKEDSISDTLQLSDGSLVLSGRSGYEVADTGSEVAFGNGVILKLNENNHLTDILTLDLPRDSSVTGLQVHNQILYYSYDYDGPITHTCDQDDSLCGLKSGIGIISL